jgi:pimeloyl-ACP methyl ester carboxylesterase
VEFDSQPSRRDVATDDDGNQGGGDQGPGRDPGSSGLPPEIVGALPPELPQSFITGGRYGDACDEEPCRDGLSCEDDLCVAVGETEQGDHCILSIECADGQCVSNVCAPFGDGEVGDKCLSSGECGAGLRCAIVTLSAQCMPEGELGMGAECESSSDCLSGLACVLASTADAPTCAPVPGAPPGSPAIWNGVGCEEASEDRVRAYFEIPGAPEAQEDDFFRLPFPNDILTDSRGRVDVSGFPTPGINPIVGLDPIKPYVDAVTGMEGWGTNSTITFRFSGPIDLDTFKGGNGIQWVDITDPDNPASAGINYKTYTGDTNYVCHDMLTVRRANGRPMEPGHVYAVWMGAQAESNSGLSIERSENFEAMLRSGAPEDEILADAHEKYAPFRAYLDAQSIDTDDVLVATVITVGPVRDLMTDLAAAVRDTGVPEASDWTLCDEGVESPCPQAEGSRACGSNSAFLEYHALVELPIFQRGEPPYMTDGGQIQTDEPVRTEPICMALTVPQGVDMPEGGWPLVVFTHGTGGSFRSHLNNDAVAKALSEAETPDGTVNFAVLGYDQVQHGPRRGESQESPDNLFFNFLNPGAAQGNPLQGAADVISIGRFAASLDVDGDTTGGDAVSIDPERIVFFGHSQGSMHGSLGLPFAPEYEAAVFSGNGVSLMHALLTKTEPVNIKTVVPIVVNDGLVIDFETGAFAGSLPGEDHHPVLSLVQHAIDPADPLNFARQIAREPIEGMTPKHIFQTYGVGDTYSPPLTMEIYATVAQLLVVEAHSSADGAKPFGSVTDEFPLLESFGFEGVPYTTGLRQYGPPDGSDGHFVVFDVPTAARDAARFLGMAASGLTPQIGE